MNREFELETRLLKLKNFLSSVSDISYAFSKLKEKARNGSVPLEQELEAYEDLVRVARLLITTKDETNDEKR